ncbi:putative quinol monooxygenase [Vallicoccus soli]|uniref:Antibiotic biosynthesis monooxygenase n=1 Tax=Vallicoccus soli TaxID=2339232 RepID=A0A3A3ZLW3_9ACTN|nr:antibiotic biosynthesis monooxygenase [Vallicoccus soli]RJK97535.1 antibiotic biosynthesis monooxygenase [Vallicoccus soli]
MVIVAGALWVDPAARQAYLEDCADVVRQARRAEGCLDFSLAPDLLDPGRVDVYERWAGEAELHRFRGAGPSGGAWDAIREARVEDYRVVVAD